MTNEELITKALHRVNDLAAAEIWTDSERLLVKLAAALESAEVELAAARATITEAARFEDTVRDMSFYQIIGNMRAILERATK